MKKIILSSLVALSLQAATIVQMGNVYDFAEEDLLVLISKKAQEKKKFLEQNQDKITEEFKEALKNYRPKNLAKLPPAKKTQTRLVDITYTLDKDIIANNKIYYKKGYKINPLKHIPLPNKYIVFNANDKNELQYVKDNFKGNLEYEFILSDGDYNKANKELDTWVYYLPQLMKDRFQIKSTISIISQDNEFIKIEEISINEKNIK
ncbi:hypothetical protein [Campylobacter sp. RM12651]|uniref:hypothetical protein n=1 Tax=Campylobacter sp. RM12651 TaxID=1660079 RepID=UPI001EFA71D9|nr:hypothetical protein [Campylobacter sp. RM12651]ULO03778.1 F-type type IV conjugative transfer system protein TraW [Campylobacter sp. RM12651]